VSVTRQLICSFLATTALFALCVGLSEQKTAEQHDSSPAATNAPAHIVPKRKMFVLSAEDFWRLDLPEGRRFDASGLTWDNGRLLVVEDGDPPLYQIEFTTNNVARLKQTSILSWPQMTKYIVNKHGRFDLEGIARDDQGRIYACEEANRWIFRWDPDQKSRAIGNRLGAGEAIFQRR
jgi:hypothetical protein